MIRNKQRGNINRHFCLTNQIEFFKEVSEGGAVDVVCIDFINGFGIGTTKTSAV